MERLFSGAAPDHLRFHLRLRNDGAPESGRGEGVDLERSGIRAVRAGVFQVQDLPGHEPQRRHGLCKVLERRDGGRSRTVAVFRASVTTRLVPRQKSMKRVRHAWQATAVWGMVESLWI